MLKRKLTTAAWEKLSPSDQEHYKLHDGGDGYDLQLDGREKDDDVGELRRAKTREKARADAAESRADAAEEKLSKAKDKDKERARKGDDIETLEQEWLDEKTQINEDHTAEVTRLRGYIKKKAIDATVAEITGRNTNKPENARMLDPHVRGRLDVVFDGDSDEPRIVVLDAKRNQTDKDLKTFEKEVVDNADFAAIIVESRASGGGAPGDNTPGRTGGAYPTDHSGVSEKQPMLADIEDPAQLKAALAARRA